jgi:hypothetical protein
MIAFLLIAFQNYLTYDSISTASYHLCLRIITGGPVISNYVCALQMIKLMLLKQRLD